MTFDKKISVGTVIQVLAFIGTGIGMWMALDRRVTASEVKQSVLEVSAKDHAEREEKRLERIEEKIDTLLTKRGR